MLFSSTKCNIVHASRKKEPITNNQIYTLKRIPLEAVESLKYLGINLPRIARHEHVYKVSAKGDRMLGFIKYNINTKSRGITIMAYKALGRPAVEYGSTITRVTSDC